MQNLPAGHCRCRASAARISIPAKWSAPHDPFLNGPRPGRPPAAAGHSPTGRQTLASQLPSAKPDKRGRRDSPCGRFDCPLEKLSSSSPTATLHVSSKAARGLRAHEAHTATIHTGGSGGTPRSSMADAVTCGSAFGLAGEKPKPSECTRLHHAKTRERHAKSAATAGSNLRR